MNLTKSWGQVMGLQRVHPQKSQSCHYSGQVLQATCSLWWYKPLCQQDKDTATKDNFNCWCERYSVNTKYHFTLTHGPQASSSTHGCQKQFFHISVKLNVKSKIGWYYYLQLVLSLSNFINRAFHHHASLIPLLNMWLVLQKTALFKNVWGN